VILGAVLPDRVLDVLDMVVQVARLVASPHFLDGNGGFVFRHFRGIANAVVAVVAAVGSAGDAGAH